MVKRVQRRKSSKPSSVASVGSSIRSWAQQNGYKVGERGRISAKILEAYFAAQKRQQEVGTEAAEKPVEAPKRRRVVETPDFPSSSFSVLYRAHLPEIPGTDCLHRTAAGAQKEIDTAARAGFSIAGAEVIPLHA